MCFVNNTSSPYAHMHKLTGVKKVYMGGTDLFKWNDGLVLNCRGIVETLHKFISSQAEKRQA